MTQDTSMIALYLRLTRRQREVLYWVSEGLSNEAVARKLVIQPCVVAAHLTRIYEEMSTLVEFMDARPNRFTLIRAFTLFFARHPELQDSAQNFQTGTRPNL